MFAPVYDDWYAEVSDVDATVAAISELAGGGSVLELGVGTGRIAAPLGEAGVPVVGVDASLDMLARCRAKVDDLEVRLVASDMAALGVRGPHAVVFVAFNTFFNLATAENQQRCLRDVHRVLANGGVLAIEAFVPTAEPREPEYSETARSDDSGGRVVRTATRYPHDQTVRGVHIHTRADGTVRRLPWQIRYVHVAELDAMCVEAGLALTDRWSTWDGAPFDPACSAHHVSLYTPT